MWTDPWSLGVVFSAVAAVSAGVIRGVAPDHHGVFQHGQAIKCLGTSGDTISVPFEAINDDFCDCADGVDEPGTGACAGAQQSLFHCENVGSTPQLLYASRVDDGICDCCDGSDEAGLRARRPELGPCANRCAEEGEIERQQRAFRLEQLKVGLAKKADNVASARAKRDRLAHDAERMGKELLDLEAAAASAKERAAASAQEPPADLQSEVEALRQKVKEQQALIEQLRADVAQLRQAKTEAAESEEKVVSEYAKWMDGAESTPGAIVDADPPGNSEFLDDDYYDDEYPDEVDPDGGDVSGNPVAEAEKKARRQREEVKNLRTKLEVLDEEHLGFGHLVNDCLNKYDGQYNYKVCLGEEASQDSVSLGTWEGWKGPVEAHFTNGQMCPGGPARMLRVLFECAADDEILSIAEPSRCVYEVHIGSPGACNPEDAGKLERPPVRHPKDEL